MILYLVCEDELSEIVMQKIAKEIITIPEIVFCTIGKKGKGYIKNRINDFNNNSNNLPFFILADLDADSCAPQLISRWLKKPCRQNMIFRIAVREIESWLLADIEGFSNYLNINQDYINKEVNYPDNIENSKEKLISLVDRSKKRELKNDIVRKEFNSYKQGPGYNMRLMNYVAQFWDMHRASRKSDSLLRTLTALVKFNDTL